MAENYFGITDTGRLRDNNEDTFIAEKVMNNRFIIACVIDGVGGYEGGEVAARIAREAILDYLSVPSGEVMTMMKEAMADANEKIQAEKLKTKEYFNMACVVTLALADVSENLFYYAHVGDTRLYLLRDESLVKVTKDHSFVGFLEDSGRLSEEQAMNHPKRNEINKALGFDSQIRIHVDYIETGESPFLPGDIILLCSDGLTDMVTNAEITSVLTGNKSLKEKGEALIKAANNKGGKDNITVVLVHNNSTPVEHIATKPVATVKKNDYPENGQEISRDESGAKVEEKRNSNKTVILLSIVCLLLLAAFFWAYWRQPGNDELIQMAPAIKPHHPQEQKFRDTINHFSGDTLILSDSLFNQPLIVAGTIHLQKDSLYLKGLKNMVLIRDSAYAGPAISIDPGPKHIVLENLTLQNFDVGIQVQGKGLYLKNVRFINCRIPVLYGILIPDNRYASGRIGDTTFLKTDSLPKP
jgi:serine/threonine protein phosphatase PrpC